MNWLKSGVSGFLLTATVLLVACGEKPADEKVVPAVTGQAQDNKLHILLRYENDERGIEPYESRMVITDDFIRIDDDENPLNFVLVDRKAAVVYSVVDENDTILVVKKMSVDIKPPMEIKLSEQRLEEDNVPRIDGKKAVQYIFEVNGVVCYQAVVAEGLMPEAASALQEYLSILAGQHAATLQNVPADQITACDISINIFNPGRHLKYGLPVREWDGKSYRRQLVEYDDDYDIPAGLFDLPKEFKRFTIQDMQEGVPIEEAAVLKEAETAK